MSILQLQRWTIPVFLVFLLGCQNPQASILDTSQTASKKVMIMDNPEKTSYDESIVDAIVRLDDVRGMDWLSENEIIIDRENNDFAPNEVDGVQGYPHNIYIYSLLTNEQSPLHAENRNQGFAQLSPDRSKLFYKTFDWQANTGQGYLMDISTRETVAITDNDAMMDNMSGRWVVNQNNIPILSPLKKVVWKISSPDEQRVASVQRLKSGEMELVITDLNGKVLSAIAQDTQIYGAAWSPDGKRLAYSSITSNGTVRGIYVADTSTGLSTTLSVDVKFIADPLHWSPTGNRLMISSTQPSEQPSRNQFVTYLVRVSGDGL